MPETIIPNQPDNAYVSSGFLQQKRAIVEMDVNNRRIRLINVDALSVNYDISTEDVTFLGSTITQHFPTFASISGSMTVHTTHGIWLDIVDHHSRFGYFPRVNFRVTQPPERILGAPSGTSSVYESTGTGDFNFTLYDLVFTSLTLMSASASGGNTGLTATLPFTANGIQVNNNLKGNGILSDFLRR